MNKYTLHLRLLISDKKPLSLAIIAALALGWLLFYFTDYPTTLGNFGIVYGSIHIGIQILLAILFGIDVGFLVHKVKHASKKQGGVFAAGSVLAAMTGGCAACGVTLASYLGLGSVFAALPFYGLEIKVASLGLLLYSTHTLCSDKCVLPQKTKRKTKN